MNKKNTPLARKIARIYEQRIGPFPGGVTNACICRQYPGRNQRAAGAWSWQLGVIERVDDHGLYFLVPSRRRKMPSKTLTNCLFMANGGSI